MKVHGLLGRLHLAFGLLGVAVLLAAPVGSAEPDRLVRTFLGVSSIPVRFPAPEGKRCCYLALAKFKDGKFLGYADWLVPSVEHFNRPHYEAELGWAEKDGKYGYFLTTPSVSQSFLADDFFRGLGVTRYLALDRAPSGRLGPFDVLGFAFGGQGTLVKDANPDDVRDIIRSKWQVIVLLMRPFESEEQAREFGKSLPKLSAE